MSEVSQSYSPRDRYQIELEIYFLERTILASAHSGYLDTVSVKKVGELRKKRLEMLKYLLNNKLI